MLQQTMRKISASVWLGPVVLVCLTLLAFANSFPGVFLLDDVQMVRDNPLVSSLDLQAIFTIDYWGAESNTGLYRPLTVLSFALNRLLLGPSPAGFHLVNLLLHAGVVLLIFFMLRRWGLTPLVAWVAAALFAVHPLHTEVVNVVVGRSELLVAFFVLSALLLARRPELWAAAGVVGCFALALLAKENAIVFLALLPLLDWFVDKDGGWWRKRWQLYVALLLLTSAWLWLRTWGVTLTAEPLLPDPFFTPLVFLPPPDRLVSAFQLQGVYLWKQLFPWPLQGIYSDADTASVVVRFATLKGVLIFAGFSGVLGLFLWGAYRRSTLALLGLLYLVTFSPTSNIVFAAGVTFAERLTYLPSVWFCAGVALLLCRGIDLGARYDQLRLLLPLFCISALLALTLMRNPVYASSVRLWEDNVRVAPRNVLAWMYLASSYAEVNLPERADAAYRQMLALAPDFPDGLRTYAGFLVDSGHPEAAIPIAIRGAKANEGKSPLAFLILAEAYYRVGDFDRALDALGSMGNFYRNYWYYWALKGMVLEAIGQEQAAIEAYRKAKPWPAGSDLSLRMGTLLLRTEQIDEAVKVLRDAAEQTDVAAAWNGLGIALAMQGQDAEAGKAFLKAIVRDPKKADYQKNLLRLEGKRP